MSQRRGGGSSSGKDKPSVVVADPSDEELVPFSKSLDEPGGGLTMSMDRESMEPLQVDSAVVTTSELASSSTTIASGNATTLPTTSSSTSTSLDVRYNEESKQMKIKNWKDGPFATGYTPATWEEEYDNYRNNVRGECMKMVDNNENVVPCGCCSAFVCSKLGAGRVGNIAILKQSTEWVEEISEEVDDNGEPKMKRFTRPKFLFVAGPYWPMLIFVTYPLILGVSGLTLFTVIPYIHPAIGFVWSLLTIGLIGALALTAFRDPGILPRYENPPPHDDGTWRWNERAHSYRPRNAWYDPDTAVIVEEFDHT